VRPRLIRALLGGIALACFALFATRTAPNALEAGRAFGDARQVLQGAAAALSRMPPEEREEGEAGEDWRRRRLEAGALLAGDLLDPPGAPADLAGERKRLLEGLVRPELPERLIAHLLPREPWEREGRTPSEEESVLGWRKLRLSSAVLGTLVASGVSDFGFLVFPDGGRVVAGPEGAGRVRAKFRYAAPASVHAAALAALLGRRDRGPFLVPDRIQLSADPTGGGSDRVLVLLEAHVPLAGEEVR
jgi:hypothetical protein